MSYISEQLESEIAQRAAAQTRAQIVAAKAMMDDDASGIFGGVNVDTVVLVYAMNATQMRASVAAQANEHELAQRTR